MKNGDQLIESSVNNPWRFANKRKDETTGLINFGLRDYDPNVGRWLGPDPIGFADGMNPYAFVHNNPLKYIDLFGTSRHHNYKKCNSFEEYFYDNRMDEFKKGGDTFIVGGQAVTINDNYELSENFQDFISDSKEMIIDVRDTIKDYSYLIDTTLGLLEIGAGFIGLEGSVAFEIGTLGLGTLVAAPVAAGATVLIADGARRIGNGYTLFRTYNKSLKNTKHEKTEQIRKKPGRDKASSKHIIEKADDKTSSITHQVTKNGKVIHQHQKHIGKYGTKRRFPDDWVEYPTID